LGHFGLNFPEGELILPMFTHKFRFFAYNRLASGLASIALLASFALPISAEEAAEEEELAAEPAAEAMDPEMVRSESSYGIGYQVARQFLSDFAQVGMGVEDVDVDSFIEGIQRGLTGEDLDEEEEQRVIAALEAFEDVLEVRMAEAQEKQKALAAENLEKGKAFLEENAERDEVVTTESGLQYEILEEGEGATYEGDGTNNAQFLLSYKGSFIDGTVFDESPEGQDVPMNLNVIPGFREALMMMPEGSTWRVYIPSDLAYGQEGAGGGHIPPNAVLIFEISLNEIVIPEAP